MGKKRPRSILPWLDYKFGYLTHGVYTHCLLDGEALCGRFAAPHAWRGECCVTEVAEAANRLLCPRCKIESIRREHARELRVSC